MADWNKAGVVTRHVLREEYTVPRELWEILEADRRHGLAKDIVRARLMARIEYADVQVDPSEIVVSTHASLIDGGSSDEIHIAAEVDVTHLIPNGGH